MSTNMRLLVVAFKPLAKQQPLVCKRNCSFTTLSDVISCLCVVGLHIDVSSLSLIEIMKITKVQKKPKMIRVLA